MGKSKRLAISAVCIFLLLTMVACQFRNPQNNGGGDIMNNLKVNPSEIPLKLWYDEEAPFINEGSEKASMMAGQDIGWQNWSLPLGNGYVGANVFGRTETERIQITEKTLANPWQLPKTVNGSTSYPEVAGLNNFSETYIDFGHKFFDVIN